MLPIAIISVVLSTVRVPLVFSSTTVTLQLPVTSEASPVLTLLAVKLITAVPFARAVTLPLLSTEATAVLLLLQVTLLKGFPSSEAVRVKLSPTFSCLVLSLICPAFARRRKVPA